MTWFRVDDQLHSHPKAMRAGPEALGLWLLAGSWSSAQLTDGWVPDYVALRLAGTAAEDYAARLVAAGLWVEGERSPEHGANVAERGWWFHEWTDHQPSRADVQADREKSRKRMAEGRARRRAEREAALTSGNASPDVRANFGAGSPSPTRPDPTRPVLPSEVGEREGEGPSDEPAPPVDDSSGSASRKRSASTQGTRLAADWWPDDAALAWFRRECPTLAAEHGAGSRATEAFRDHFRSQSAASRAVRTDWTAVWRNWLRREEREAATQAKRTGGKGRPNADDRLADFATRTALPDHGHHQPYDEPLPLPGDDEVPGATVHQLTRSAR